MLRCNKGVRFAHVTFDWEGCGSPLPNPPRRPTTASDHGQERRHDHRKPKDGLQEGTRTDGDTTTENPKTVSRKELERTATTGKDSDNRPIKGSAHETDEIVR